MKLYKTVDGVMNYIRRNKQGNEQSLNDTLMFGHGVVYAYKDAVNSSGIRNLAQSSETFYHLTDESEIKKIVEYSKKRDGYLYIA